MDRNDGTPPDTGAGTETPQTVTRDLTIINRRGLHARAAARFVRLAETFSADISVGKGDMTVSGRSIMGLMMLAAAPGCVIHVTAGGADAPAAMEAIAALVNGRFDED